jgi:hypothetical protein
MEMAPDEDIEALKDAVACAAGVTISVLTLFLCSAWLFRSASHLQLPALIVMSVFGSAVIALAECRLPPMARGPTKPHGGEHSTATSVAPRRAL